VRDLIGGGTERGIALITAMLVVAVATGATVAMASLQFVEIRRTGNLFAFDRAAFALERLEQAALLALMDDSETSGYDSAEETWGGQRFETNIAGARAHGTLIDVQGRFNLNNMILIPGAGAAVPAAANRSRPQAAPPQPAAPVQALRQAPAISTPSPAGGSLPGPPPAGAPPSAPEPISEGIPVSDDELIVERGGETYRPRWGGGYRLSEVYGRRTPDAAAGGEAPALPAERPAATPDGGLAPAMTVSYGPQTAFAVGVPDPTMVPPVGDDPLLGNVDRTLGAQELAVTRFRLLLRALDADADIVQALLDWIDPDTETRYPNGAEDDYYMRLDPPYRAANRPLASVRELLLVRGVTPELLERLAARATALPVRTDINVNTASREVLMSLGPGIDAATADRLIDARRAQPFLDVQSFQTHPAVLGRLLDSGELAVGSRYFTLTSTVSADRLELAAVSILGRGGAGGGRVVSRIRGYAGE
jgi:general secretion pathway protein K